MCILSVVKLLYAIFYEKRREEGGIGTKRHSTLCGQAGCPYQRAVLY